MELRQYWRVLVRRRKVVLYTFLIALVLSLVTTAYSAYSSFYKGSAVIDVQMQPEPAKVTGAVVDPQQAAHQNTDQVVIALSERATEQAYFTAVSKALKKRGLDVSWQTLGQNIDIHPGKSHAMYINWSDSDPNKATAIVGAAAQKLLEWVPVWKHDFLPNGPQIRTSVIQPPYYQRTHLTKSLSGLALKVALGLVAAIILAYLFEYLDTTVQDEADVQRWLGLPTLAVIPGGQRTGRARSVRSRGQQAPRARPA